MRFKKDGTPWPTRGSRISELDRIKTRVFHCSDKDLPKYEKALRSVNEAIKIHTVTNKKTQSKMREQFNLDNFLAGKYERFELRNGEPVQDLTYFPRANKEGNCLAGVPLYLSQYLKTWDICGNDNPFDIESEFDLFGILKPQS